MDINEIISKINKSVDALDFSTARKYIEENIELVSKNRVHLKNNAREILKFITDKIDSGEKQLTKTEITTINSINVYATRFDLRGLKLVIKGNEQLLLKGEIINYLNADAKILLEGMGAINRGNNNN